MNKEAFGSSFNDFLEKESILIDSEAIAIKKVTAFEVQKLIKEVLSQKYRWQKDTHTDSIK